MSEIYNIFVCLNVAVEKATLYLDKDELPPHWDRDALFGSPKPVGSGDGDYDDDSDSEVTINY